MKIATSFGEIDCSVVRERRKSISLRFENHSTLIVSIPRYSLANVDRILERHMPWIVKHAEELRNSKDLVSMGRILCNGTYVPLEFVEGFGRAGAHFAEGKLVVKSSDRASGMRAVERFIRRQSEQIVSPMVFQRLAREGMAPRSVKVRRMRKWGLCTSKRDITFNAYISMLPFPVLEYVVCHELAHLKEMNHSRDFWGVVESMCPNYKAMRKELKLYNATLELGQT
ncbi:MAG: M48 family metallopeptidase [Candidatus Micrarchaeota archaeon]|nr:M48 family metallopeptidase [Candidatus Micrarchaeota archaeon]MDE1804936.1 M48 family metallopeptidase [Candidatus Micrarchaeota archaeon]MDE1847139.1 M48 family metallopeptidase [Candidatus Micrarchaeota archaeon]